jgi:hypothetical protein
LPKPHTVLAHRRLDKREPLYIMCHNRILASLAAGVPSIPLNPSGFMAQLRVLAKAEELGLGMTVHPNLKHLD